MVRGGPNGSPPIAIQGTGRMGRSLFEAASGRSDLQICAMVGPNAPDWELPENMEWAPALDQLGQRPELVIDFSLPDGTRAAANWCRTQAVALLSGVTGLPDDVRDALRRCADAAPVLWSPNLSLGVNLLVELVSRASAVIDADAPVRIDDLHHRWKKDTPSGTALMLGAAIASQRGGDDNRIEYHSRREGEVIGEHRVRFALGGEEIELTHRAGDRAIYARGALAAGLWLLGRPPGLYAAADWLASR